jgi:hypothetical protein
VGLQDCARATGTPTSATNMTVSKVAITEIAITQSRPAAEGRPNFHPVVRLLGACILLALAAALAFAAIVAGASVALATHQTSESTQDTGSAVPSHEGELDVPETAFTGVITDSHCGARHIRNSHMSPAECARACVRKGATYVLVDGERRYVLNGSEDTLAPLAGTRARVTGRRDGNSIVVNSARAPF